MSSRSWPARGLLVLLLLAGSAWGPAPLMAQTAAVADGAAAITRAIDLRSLPTAGAAARSGPPIEIPRQLSRPVRGVEVPPASEPVRPSPALGGAGLRELRQFEGIPFTGVHPPDPVGAPGPDHYIQMVNARTGSLVTVLDKRGRTLVQPFELRSLIGDSTAPCFTGARGDPIVLFDRLARRWLLSELARNLDAPEPFHLCVYVSRGADPVTSGWHVYQFATARFPDYPKYAVWPDGYYVTTNETDPSGQPTPTVYGLERSAMLRGRRARLVTDSVPPLANLTFQALTPATFAGPRLPPAGRQVSLLRQVDTEALGVPGLPSRDLIEVWRARARFGRRPRLDLALDSTVRVSELDSDLCGLTSFSCIVQPDAAPPLDPLREVVMFGLSYKSFGGGREALVGNFTTDVDGSDRAGTRWFDLRRRGAGWTLGDEGTQAPDTALNRWMGSVAMDRDGNLALGYSVASAAVFPGLRYAGRLATDPKGQLRAEQRLIEGVNSQDLSVRWGDYAAMVIDPVDDCTFWFTGEYVGAGRVWRTRIAALAFPGCGGR